MRWSRHVGTTEAVSDAPLLPDVSTCTGGQTSGRKASDRSQEKEEEKARHAQTRRVFSVSLMEISVTFLSRSDIFSAREASLSLKGSTQTLSDVYISSFLYSGFHLSALSREG